jgi:ribosome-binding protein aMBF1 (putative translation factor)
LVKYAAIDVRGRRANNPDMTIVEITGCMLRAARSLAGLSQQEFAERFNLASLSRGLERLVPARARRRGDRMI